MSSLDYCRPAPAIRVSCDGIKIFSRIERLMLTRKKRLVTNVIDYVTRRFDPEGIRGWNTALRDLQIQLELQELSECGLEVRIVS